MPVYYPDFPSVSWQRPFFIIGVTGSIGAGKSQVASFFCKSGAKLVDADAIAKGILYSKGLRKSLFGIFGENVWDTAVGGISKRYIANAVFNDDSKRKALNALIHPLVEEKFAASVNVLGVGDVLVYDVPLLFEASVYQKIDLTIVVDAPTELRYQRVYERSGWSKEEFYQREHSQFSAKEKKQLADMILVNDGDISELCQSVRQIYTMVKNSNKNTN